MNYCKKISVITLLFSLYNPTTSYASLSNSGYVLGDGLSATYFHDIAIDSKNRIIAVGETGDPFSVIARYLPDGRLDTSFNGTGYINVTGDYDGQQFFGVTVDNQDRIIAVGATTGVSGLVVRFTETGALDTTFSSDGILSSAGDNSTEYRAVAIDGNGNIVVCGTASTGDTDAVVTRLTPAGALDTANFNTGSVNGAPGYVNAEGDTNSKVYYSLIIDVNNNIILCGQTDKAGDNNGAVARFTSAGILDTNFNPNSVAGGQGYINAEGETNSNIYYKVIQDPQGRYILFGQTDDSKGLITRLKNNGELDTTFNSTGYYSDNSATTSNRYHGGAIFQPEGSNDYTIIATGVTTGGTANITVLTSNGTLDTNFNKTGYLNSPADGATVYHKVILNATKLLTIAGGTGDPYASLTRYYINGTLDSAGNLNSSNSIKHCKNAGLELGLL